MSEPDFGAVDEYIAELLAEDDPALKAALAASEGGPPADAPSADTTAIFFPASADAASSSHGRFCSS